MKNTKQELQKLRDKIDIIDDEIITALAKRINVVRQVGHFKKTNRVGSLDSKRFDEVLKTKIIKGEELNLSPIFIKALYNLIHDYSVSIEEDIKK